MQKTLFTLCLAILFFSTGNHTLYAVEPDPADYMCTPVFTGNNSTPNVALLLDNGLEMKHAVWHEDFDNNIDFRPETDPALQVEVGDGNATSLDFVFASMDADFTPDTTTWLYLNNTTVAGEATVRNPLAVDLLDIEITSGTFNAGDVIEVCDRDRRNASDCQGSATIEAVIIGPPENGFYHLELGYAVVDSGGGECNPGPETCYLTPMPDDLDIATVDAAAEGLAMDASSATTITTDGNATINAASWTINGRTITLPAVASSAVDDDNVKDNAGFFVFSANYLNWLFFYDTLDDIDTDGDNETLYDFSTLPAVSRFYYAKSAIFATAEAYGTQIYYSIFHFSSGTTEGATQAQPFGEPADAAGNLDSNFVNNVNNMNSTTYAPLAEGLATIGEDYVDLNQNYITGPCQDHFIILLSAGTSSYDAGIPSPSVSQDNAYEPANISDLDGDGSDCDENTDPACSTSLTVDGVSDVIPVNYLGSTYLDDVAYYLASNGIVDSDSDNSGDTPVYTYTVGMMAGDGAEKFLINTSNNGNGNPGLTTSADPYGKYHFAADTPEEIAQSLSAAMNAILERPASATSVSVLATSGEGEGIVVQAYFRQSEESGGGSDADVLWVGHMHALWVDSYGNMREDTPVGGLQDMALDVTEDYIVTYFLDLESGDTKIKRFEVSDANPYPETNVSCTEQQFLDDNCTYSVEELNDIFPLWDAGKKLADMSTSQRKIFTYIDYNQNNKVDGVGSYGGGTVTTEDPSPFDGYWQGDTMLFHYNNWPGIMPSLGIKAADWDYLDLPGGALTPEQTWRAIWLSYYVMGGDVWWLRSRNIDGDIWKLGDIIHSTPVTVSKPPDNYHVIYSDESFQDYYDNFKDRETMVYVGANDGMLHAFTSWQYSETTQSFSAPADAEVGEEIGDEVWAYIPQALLPHLKWLPDNSYQHTYYVDLKPKVFDAKILPDDTHYTDSDADDNWGTFLLLGLNLGGQPIEVTDDFDSDNATADTTRTFKAGYSLLDITDPRNPRLMWERTYDDLQATISFPGIVKVEDNWFAVFGSGPSDFCEGNSNQPGNAYVVDLKTGDPYMNGANDWLFQTDYSNAFFNSPVSLDKKVNYNVDAVYLGTSYYDDNSSPTYTDPDLWKGKLHRIAIPWKDAFGDYDGDNIASDVTNYSENPNDATNPWTFYTLFEVDAPITASATLSLDKYDNIWIFGGTGRYLNEYDKPSTQQQYIFGIKDPFFNYQLSQDASGPYPDPLDKYYDNTAAPYNVENYHNYTNAENFGALTTANLFYANPYSITTNQGIVSDNGTGLWGGGTDSWDVLYREARNLDGDNTDYWHGWYRKLTDEKERVLQKSSILGGTLFVPSFVPSEEVCAYGGDSYLYGLYFETGTAYYNPVFLLEIYDTVTVGAETYDVSDYRISLGEGKSSSLGIHIGQEEGATSFIQLSTGVVETESLTPALKIKSGLTSWKFSD